MLLVTFLLLLAAVLSFVAEVARVRSSVNWLALGLLFFALVPFLEVCKRLF